MSGRDESKKLLNFLRNDSHEFVERWTLKLFTAHEHGENTALLEIQFIIKSDCENQKMYL